VSFLEAITMDRQLSQLLLLLFLLHVIILSNAKEDKSLVEVVEDAHNDEQVEEFFERVMTTQHFDESDTSDVNSQDGSAPKPQTKACWKDGEPRGRGKFPDKTTRTCPENEEKSMGMCYPHCGEKRTGLGPICLDDCSKIVYKSDGIVFCCDNQDICKDLVQNLAMKLPKSLVRFALDLASNPNDVRRILRDFRAFAGNAMQLRLPLCPNVKESIDGEPVEEPIANTNTKPDEGNTKPDEGNTKPDEGNAKPDEVNAKPDEAYTKPNAQPNEPVILDSAVLV